MNDVDRDIDIRDDSRVGNRERGDGRCKIGDCYRCDARGDDRWFINRIAICIDVNELSRDTHLSRIDSTVEVEVVEPPCVHPAVPAKSKILIEIEIQWARYRDRIKTTGRSILEPARQGGPYPMRSIRQGQKGIVTRCIDGCIGFTRVKIAIAVGVDINDCT